MTLERRVLFLSSFNPLQTTNGAALRAMQMLKFLQRRYRVDLVFEGRRDTETTIPPLPGIERVVTVPPSPRYRSLLAPFSALPYHHAMMDQGGFSSVCRNLAEERGYMFVWLNKSWLYPAVRHALPDTPVFLEQHAAEYDVWENLARNDPRWFVRWYSRFNGRKVDAFEKRIYPDLAGAICISPADLATTLAHYPRIPLLAVPMGIDCGYYRTSPRSAPDPYTLVFSGNDATRNAVAMRRYVMRIAPLLRSESTSFRLLWVGKVDFTRHDFLPDPAVEVTGSVEHVPVYFDRGAIFIAPFDMGEGVKVKIVEALAMGKVIVSTRMGIRGLDLDGLPFVRVADDDHDFARSILDLAKDPNLPDLALAAQRYAEKNFEFDKVMAPLQEFIATALVTFRKRRAR